MGTMLFAMLFLHFLSIISYMIHELELYTSPGISASPSEDNMRYFNVMILGPTQSPYEGPQKERGKEEDMGDPHPQKASPFQRLFRSQGEVLVKANGRWYDCNGRRKEVGMRVHNEEEGSGTKNSTVLKSEASKWKWRKQRSKSLMQSIMARGKARD
ncbi:hypothetical protein Syun_008821 [Stephania yunnanensis]|uniref:Uncharacterized protein n=1 Tax=Stephania yunnanensis TaxID=152371 RepID=A0AAP0KFV8_9MAGN